MTQKSRERSDRDVLNQPRLIAKCSDPLCPGFRPADPFPDGVGLCDPRSIEPCDECASSSAEDAARICEHARIFMYRQMNYAPGDMLVTEIFSEEEDLVRAVWTSTRLCLGSVRGTALSVFLLSAEVGVISLDFLVDVMGELLRLSKAVAEAPPIADILQLDAGKEKGQGFRPAPMENRAGKRRVPGARRDDN